MGILIGSMAVLWAVASSGAAAAPVVFNGASDASAAIGLDAEHFVMADDENNTLRVYRLDTPSEPVRQFNLDSVLSVDDRWPEADIEGAARIGDRIYWITSHGRNTDGKERPNRYALFATDIAVDAEGALTLKPVGRPYRGLAEDFAHHPAMQFLRLGNVIRLGESLTKKEQAALAPKEKGLNIEGLAAGPDGSLLIGLRNPVYNDPVGKRDKAIVLVLCNPEAMVMTGKAAEFAAPVLLDADGLGVRSLERIGPARYIVAAGGANGKNKFAFYEWAGEGSALKRLEVELTKDFTPEAVFQVPGTETVWVLSDDGTLEKPVGGAGDCLPGELLENGMCPNKFLADAGRRTFRAILFELSVDGKQ